MEVEVGCVQEAAEAFGGPALAFYEACLAEGKNPDTELQDCGSTMLKDLVQCVRAGVLPTGDLVMYACCPGLPEDGKAESVFKIDHPQVVRVLDFLIKHDGLPPSFDPQISFHKACYHGRLGVAQWLKQQFPDVDHRAAEGDDVFRWVCYNGHLGFAMWLKKRFPDIDNRTKNSAFQEACTRGHLEVAQWLKQEFPDIDHRAHKDETFRYACRNGHLEVAQWLKRDFGRGEYSSHRQSSP